MEDTSGPFREHKVTDFYCRTEFQGRGSAHEHLVIYCKNAPTYNSEDINFIDRFITVHYEPKNPLIAFQRHKHTTTCYKGYEKSKICRFHYPLPVMPETRIL